MSSGHRRVFQNTRERVISPDFNRAQAFEAKRLAEMLKGLALAPSTVYESSYGVTYLDSTVISAPTQAVVIDGCMVYAPLGGTELGVTKGSVIFNDPDGLTGSTVSTPANPDDSVGKYVVDESGVAPGSGTLVLTANGGGGVRVDIIECQRNPDVVAETDNRDIFDQSTGLFTPSSVSKVITDGLLYRIRIGAPGGGLPVMAQGWVPVAVAAVPVGATSWDNCELYDVRPLLRDRAPFPTQALSTLPARRAFTTTDFSTNVAQRRLSGVIEREGGWGYKVGGQISSIIGGVLTTYFDMADANNQEPGIAPGVNKLAYLYALFPGGLPRWVRYGKTAFSSVGGRVPQGPRGILCISTKAPLDVGGVLISSAIVPPVNSGFDAGMSSTVGVLLAAVPFDSTGTTIAPVIEDDRMQKWGITAGAVDSYSNVKAPAVVAATIDYYDLVVGTDIPMGAKSIMGTALARFSGAGATEFLFYEEADLYLQGSITVMIASGNPKLQQSIMPAGGAQIAQFSFELPIAQNTLNQRIRVAWAQTAVTKDVGQSHLVLTGWRM